MNAMTAQHEMLYLPRGRQRGLQMAALAGSLLLHVLAAVLLARVPSSSLIAPSAPATIQLAEGESAAEVIYLPAWMAEAIAEPVETTAPPPDPLRTMQSPDAPQRAEARPDTPAEPPTARRDVSRTAEPRPAAGDALATPRQLDLSPHEQPDEISLASALPAEAPTPHLLPLWQPSADRPAEPEMADIAEHPSQSRTEVTRGVRSGVKLLDPPSPRYPEASRHLGEEGVVLVRVKVRADGQVAGVALAEPCPHGRLNQAALDAARRARYAPARSADGPIESAILVPFRFKLN